MTGRKRKIDLENRAFKDERTKDYFFVQNNGKSLCLMRTETIAVIKVDDIKRHYNSKHALKFDALQEERVKKASDFKKKKQSSQQSMFVKMDSASEKAIKTNYVVSQIIAKRMKLFSDAKCIKEFLNPVVQVVCPEKKSVFNSVVPSDYTITRRVEDLSSNLKEQLHHVVGNFEAFALAFVESTDISDIAQLCIFVRGIDTEFNITEDLLNLRSVRGTCTGDDIFCECNFALTEANLSYEKLVGVATNGARAMIGNQKGLQGCLIKELETRNYLVSLYNSPRIFEC